jgi:hypothetical protein
MKNLFSLLLSLCISSSLYAQKCDKVLVTGKVIDTLLIAPFYNIMVVNNSTGRGVFGNPDGTFNAYASRNDSVTISIKNYRSFSFPIIPDSNCQVRIVRVLNNRVQTQQEVIVTPLKSIQQIKEERAHLAMRETKTTSGLDAFKSPITYLYERFSQKEKSKHKAAELTHIDNQRKILKDLLWLYVTYEIVQLEDEDFDSFISFLNITEDFLKTSTDLELIAFIKDKFEHYSKIKLRNN